MKLNRCDNNMMHCAILVLVYIATFMECMARPEVSRKGLGEFGHRQQQETQSRRHISNDSSALQNNNFGGGHYERSRYKSTSSETNPDLIFFPGETHRRPNFTIPTGLSKNCTGDMCEDVDGYPDDYVRYLLNHTSKYDHYFRPPIAFSERNNFDKDEKQMCETRVTRIVPKTAKNTSKKEVLIANVEGKQQAIVQETCVSPSTPAFAEVIPNGYTIECKQKFTVRSLLAISEVGSPYEDTFEIPSCCVCVYKKTN